MRPGKRREDANMKRTIGTIALDIEDSPMGRLIHDDQTGRFICRISGKDERLEWRESRSWRAARRDAIAWYGCPYGGRDFWVLCLRPVAALVRATSEEVDLVDAD